MIPGGLSFALDLGWAVFPVRAADSQDGRAKAKEPLTAHGLKNATTNKEQIAEWSREHRDCAWGAAMGHGSLALDVDRKNGVDGEASLAEIFSKHEPLPDTLTNRTWSGARQLLLAHDAILSFKNSVGEVAPGIDVRSDGGYIVIPPSCVNGRPYAWELVHKGMARAPTWLLDLLPKKGAKPGAPKDAAKGDVPEGTRNRSAYRTACFLRGRNVPEGDAWRGLQEWNLTRCSPPLEMDELRKCFDNAWKHAPGFALTDLGNAERVAAEHGDDLRWVPEIGWHRWDGVRWEADREGKATLMVSDVIRSIYAEAEREPDSARRKALAAHAMKSESRSRVEAAEKMAQWQPGITELLEAFDKHPLLLAVRNGVIDLTTGELRSGSREHRIRLRADVKFDASAGAPRWEQFLQEIFADDAELIAFMRRALGYQVRIPGPDGSMRYKRFKTLKAAERYAREMEGRKESGDADPAKRVKWRELVAEFREARMTHDLRPSTIIDLNKHLRRLDSLADRDIRSLKARDFEAIRNDIITDIAARRNSRVARGRRTANKVIATARMLLKFAEEREYVARNVASFVKMVKRADREEHTVDESCVFTPGEAQRMIDNVDREDQLAVNFLFKTGVRISELAGLKWTDVEWASRRIFVRHQASEHGESERTKTAAGRRHIELTSDLLAGLRERKIARQGVSPFCFGLDNGSPLDVNNWRNRIWNPALRRAGLRHITPHQARHSFASWLIMAGVDPLEVAKRLGHKDPSVTLKVYAHWFEARKTSRTGEALEAFIAKEVGCFSVVSGVPGEEAVA